MCACGKAQGMHVWKSGQSGVGPSTYVDSRRELGCQDCIPCTHLVGSVHLNSLQ